MLLLPTSQWLSLVGHCLDGVPLEACGLLGGHPDGRVVRFVPCRNADGSSRTYSIDGREILAAERSLDGDGLEIIGVAHSHTHTDAYPSPTDVERAALLSDWHFVVVSLRDTSPTLRSYRIRGGNIEDEPVVLLSR